MERVETTRQRKYFLEDMPRIASTHGSSLFCLWFRHQGVPKGNIMDISGDTSTDSYNTLSSVTLTRGTEWVLVVDLTCSNVLLKSQRWAKSTLTSKSIHYHVQQWCLQEKWTDIHTFSPLSIHVIIQHLLSWPCFKSDLIEWGRWKRYFIPLDLQT